VKSGVLSTFSVTQQYESEEANWKKFVSIWLKVLDQYACPLQRANSDGLNSGPHYLSAEVHLKTYHTQVGVSLEKSKALQVAAAESQDSAKPQYQKSPRVKADSYDRSVGSCL
jgi:hypothetical protein